MRYLSIDVETTGLDPEKHALVELAMVAEDTDHADVSVSDLAFFRCYVHHGGGAFWDPFCLKMHAGPIIEAQSIQSSDLYPSRDDHWVQPTIDGVPVYTPAQMEEAATHWLVTMGVTPLQQATVAGKNFATFDRLFLPPTLRRYFNRRVLDAGSVFVDWNARELPSLKDLLGAEPAHNALDDARAVIHVLRRAYAK